MKAVKDYFANDRFARLCGIELVEVKDGRALARMTIRDEHRNGHGVVHGGALFTLADFAGAAVANGLGRVSLAVQGGIHYQHPGRDGVLTAEAELVGHSNRLATVRVSIHDESGMVLAFFQGMAYRLDQPLPGAELPPS